MKTLTRFACIAALLSLVTALNLAVAVDATKEALADGDFKIVFV